ncbi:hypothetical protein [Caulobacter sp. DWR1-3-2b1]|uniref:hypothetical protein n=1 Tax=Caulobacter sp. DWR1-3-2b1 TaxID=2804670 RepID=UPI003CF66F53
MSIADSAIKDTDVVSRRCRFMIVSPRVPPDGGLIYFYNAVKICTAAGVSTQAGQPNNEGDGSGNIDIWDRQAAQMFRKMTLTALF